eukprot:TRINITY_DN7350_c0_g1_i1.p1 TRINITY_DN7350_c0_g1~~TRINITY_DN7350_c0_g1_i1.p1  ORF type:complete len:743 (+),score=157.80 TRINITY_DN7350_c0_g1_i1:54-2282(+)
MNYFCGCANPGLPDIDAMTLSVVDKWKRHKIFPLKPILDTLGLILVIVLVVVVHSQLSNYYRLNRKTFQELFLQDDVELQMVVKTHDLVDHIQNVVNNYHLLPQITVQKYIYDINRPNYYNISMIPPVKMTLSILTPSLTKNVSHYNLTYASPLGPLNIEDPIEISDFLDKVSEIELDLTVISVDFDDPDQVPYKTWNILVYYTNNEGFMDISMDVNRKYSASEAYSFGSGLNCVVVFTSTVTLISSLIRFISTLRIYSRTMKRFNSIPKERLKNRFLSMGIVPPPTEWNQIPVGVRLEFWSPWALYSMLGDFLIVTGSMISLVQHFRVPSLDIERLIFGVGVLIICARMIEYLEVFPNFYTLIVALRYSSSKLLRYILSVLPLLFGFGLAGLTLFGPHSDSFSDYGNTIVTLFALMNGDDMHGTFTQLEQSYPLGVILPRVFLFVFVILFMSAILNVFIFIIEDGFHLAKLVSAKYHKDYETLPGTVITMFQAEWQALQKMLDMEKLFLALDAEAFLDDTPEDESIHTSNDLNNGSTLTPEQSYITKLRHQITLENNQKRLYKQQSSPRNNKDKQPLLKEYSSKDSSSSTTPATTNSTTTTTTTTRKSSFGSSSTNPTSGSGSPVKRAESVSKHNIIPITKVRSSRAIMFDDDDTIQQQSTSFPGLSGLSQTEISQILELSQKEFTNELEKQKEHFLQDLQADLKMITKPTSSTSTHIPTTSIPSSSSLPTIEDNESKPSL